MEEMNRSLVDVANEMETTSAFLDDATVPTIESPSPAEDGGVSGLGKGSHDEEAAASVSVLAGKEEAELKDFLEHQRPEGLCTASVLDTRDSNPTPILQTVKDKEGEEDYEAVPAKEHNEEKDNDASKTVGANNLEENLKQESGVIRHQEGVAVVNDKTKDRHHHHHQQQQQLAPIPKHTEPLSVASLPNDSLHSVASFLSPFEWANFGLCDKKTNTVCRNVFRRVRMHGYRCATEVITAWKLDQHADAKELCALYIRAGVPIYPYSLGHSYHTLVWRLGVEVKELQEQRRKSNSDKNSSQNESTTTAQNENESTEENVHATAVDPFFHERDEARAAHDYQSSRSAQKSSSYLEEKAQYILKGQEDESNVDDITSRLRRQMSMRTPPRIARPAAAAAQNNEEAHPRAPARWNSLVVARGETSSRPQLNRSNSFSEFRFRRPKASLKIHRHLLDQHLLGKTAVNDNGGKMIPSIVSLAVDFFHPHFSFQVNNCTFKQEHNDGRANSLQTSPTPFMVATALNRDEAELAGGSAGADGTPNENTSEILDIRQSVLANAEDSDSDEEGYVLLPRPVTMHPTNNGGEHQSDRLVAGPGFPPTAQETEMYHGITGGFRKTEGQDILSRVDVNVYSASSSKSNGEDHFEQELMLSHLKTRFATYQRRLEKSLLYNDSESFEEFMLDFWDEFLPQTAMIQYYDQHTAVPRLSCLQKFLSRPCPKAVGIVQCEIERVKVGSKKKGVNMKGRFFPTYEYRLFIRDRRSDPDRENDGENSEEEDENRSRRDTVLMIAKNRGRKYSDNSGQAAPAFSSKKSSNNYYVYLPHQDDVDLHYKSVNGRDGGNVSSPNGAGRTGSSTDTSLLCRLQSNFIGTEFQIYTPKTMPMNPKPLTKRSLTAPHSTNYNIASDDEDVLIVEGGEPHSPQMTKWSRFSRLSLRGVSGGGTAEFESSRSLDPSLSSPLALRRTRSSGDVTPSRKARVSRRVSAADAVETKHYSTQTHTPFYEEEDGAITYTANLLGSRPRIMDVCIPKVDSNGVGSEWKRYLEYSEEIDSTSSSANRMLNNLKQLQQRGDTDDWATINNNQASGSNVQSRNRDGQTFDGAKQYVPPDDFGLLSLQNRPPWWNVELGSFVLNFGGRVSVASVKNFQLCDRSDQDYIMLQFGRIQGRHSFTMDFQYPLTGVQAFAIAISSLQSKISFG